MRPQELVPTWLRNAASAHRALSLHRFGRSDPHRALRAIARIAERPGVEDHLHELSDPLLLVISQHGPEVIQVVEALAAGSARFRLCLGLVSPNPALPITPAIWTRLSQAAGVGMGPIPESLERLFNQVPGLEHAVSAEVPDPEQHFSGAELDDDQIARDWMTYHSTLWASSAVDNIAQSGTPEEAVALLREIADGAASDARSWLGAGTLENLLAYRGAEVIDLVEAAARTSSGFREALRGVWQRNMSAALWRRVCAARGESAT